MIQDFNKFDIYDIPEVSIHYPNRKIIGYLTGIFGFSVDLKINSLSEVILKIASKCDDNENALYQYVVQKNKIHIKNLGWFTFQDVSEEIDGDKLVKTAPAYSEECFMNYRSVNLLEGTYKFYDTDQTKKTIMSIVMGYMPTWKIGNISSSLWNEYRYFDVTTDTLYSFVMSSVSDAYECFFVFDTEEKIVNVYTSEDLIKKTSINLSPNNLIKSSTITEKSSEFVTALSVTGGGDLDIRAVNPVGGNYIYDFSYPMSKNMMSTELSNAISNWNAKIDEMQPSYANKLTEYKTLNSAYITLTSELADLNSQRTSVESLMQIRIDAGINDLSDLNEQILVIDKEIEDKENEINTNRELSESIRDEISTISDSLKIENNFSDELYYELLDFIVESSYQNENIIKTSVMTQVEIQDQAQKLYDQGKSVLSKISQPRYEFVIDSVNFLFLKEYKHFTEQIAIGSQITIDLEDGRVVNPVLLGVSFDYYSPSTFTMTFGNRLRLDDSMHEFSDLIEGAISAGNSVNVNSSLWNDWNTNYQQTVSGFVSSSLNAAKNNIINSENQNIVIDSTGLHGRKTSDSGSGYDPKQIWLTNHILAFTKDGWDSVHAAIGNVTLPDGSETYGVVADAIIGNLVASSELVIKNENNKFLVDANGATLQDATFELTTTSGSSKISISPTIGLRIQSKLGDGTYSDKLYLDASGNAVFAGKIVAESGTIGGLTLSSDSIYSSNDIIKLNSDGTGRLGALSITKSNNIYTSKFSGALEATTGKIGGWAITPSGLESSYGDYIRSNGTGKLGLLSYNGNTARFDGTVLARNISANASDGYITGSQIGGGAIGAGNLYKGDYATQTYVDQLYARLATIDRLLSGSAAISVLAVDTMKVGNALYVNYGGGYMRFRVRQRYIDGENRFILEGS